MVDLMSEEFGEFVENIKLIDHHVHGTYRADGDEVRFQNALNEGNSGLLAQPHESYDSQLGFAIRRWCTEPLGLGKHATASDYWTRRAELGEGEISRLLLPKAGVSDWLVDTGFKSDEFLSPAEIATASGNAAHEVVRLEVLAEALIREITSPSEYELAFAQKLSDLANTAIAAKTVLAYRGGFAQNLTKPTSRQVAAAAASWQDTLSGTDNPRLTDITLIASGIHAALSLKMPLQFHVGFGDRDLDLNLANPSLLMPFLRTAEAAQSSILLLHCYPYEREAGFLAQAFDNVYMDVGLALNFTGARSRDLIARSLEMAPFTRILYSSDAFGPAELHYLGARLWRNGMANVIGDWIDNDDWSLKDGRRVANLIGRHNAERVYSLN